MLSRVTEQTEVIIGTSQMAEAMRLHDWTGNPLGAIAEWPLELLSAVNLMLSCPFPVALHCGAEFVMLYNDGYRDICGERHPAALGSPFQEVWPDAWKALSPNLLATFTYGKAIHGDAFFLPIKIHGVLADRHWTFTFSPLYVSGRVAGVFNTCHDVTHAVQMEQSLQASEVQASQVLDAMTDSVAILDFNWTVLFLNARARAGLAAGGEMAGRNYWECFPATVFNGSPWVENFTRTMTHRLETEFEQYSPAPLNHWVNVVARPCREGIIVFLRDVTQQKLAAKALLQNEKLAAVGRLASSIAHEINNPLESVTNLIYLARASNDLSEAQEYLETAERELRRVGAITNQTLRFHRQSSKPVSVSCLDVIEASMSIYQGRLVNSNIAVERRKRAEKPVICFEGEIRQVLHNLIGNSIDAMPPEGGRLLLRSREARDWKDGRRGLVLTVADTAGGMSPETMSSIFEPFFTTKGHAGTGLGLWISQDIVARHNGVLRVKSSLRAGGTVCTLFLPFDAAVR